MDKAPEESLQISKSNSVHTILLKRGTIFYFHLLPLILGGGHIYLWTDQHCIQTASLLYSTKLNKSYIPKGNKTISVMLSKKLHTVVCVCLRVYVCVRHYEQTFYTLTRSRSQPSSSLY
jgi:hypothetical protein